MPDQPRAIRLRLRDIPIRFPLLLLGASTALALLLAFAALRLTLNTAPEAILESDTRTLATYQLVEAALEQQTVLLISMQCDNPFRPEHLRAMHQIGETFLSQPGVDDVKSITHSALPYRDGVSLRFRPYLPRHWTPENLEKCRQFSLNHPLVRNILVSADGHHAIIAVTYDPTYFANASQRSRFAAQVDALLLPFAQNGPSFRTISVPQAQAELETIFRHDTTRFVLLTVAFLLLAVLLFFRSWRMLLYVAVLLVAFTALIAGIAGLSGLKIGISSIALFPLLLAVELTLLAHVSRTFTTAFSQTGNVLQAVRLTRTSSWRSCLFAALTTAAGLLSLLLSDLSEVRSFGIAGAVGVLVGLLVVYGPGMSLLVVLFRTALPGSPRSPFRLATFAARNDRPHRRRVLLAAATLLAISLPGIALLQPDIRVTQMLPVQSQTRKMATEFEQIYQGRNFLQLSIESNRRGGATDHKFLSYVMNVQSYADTLPNVTGSYSFASIMAMINQVWSGWAEGSYALPNPIMLKLFTRLLRTQSFPFTHVLADDDWSACHLYVRTADMPSRDYLKLVNTLRSHAESTLPDGIELTVGAGLHSFLEADQRIRQAQIKSAAAALGAIFFVLLLLWRSLRLAAVATTLTGVPILVTLGIAGYAGIPLNAATFTVAAIVAGIAVDDIVHLVTYWQQLDAGNEPDAVCLSLRAKGSPIVFTSILLIGLFAAFTTTSFPPAIHFGLLAAIAFALTLLAVLLLLPTLLPKRTLIPCSPKPKS